MWLLHAGHAYDCAGLVAAAFRAQPRDDTRAPLRQLLPLYRLSRHCRRRRGYRAFASRARGMKVTSAKAEGLSVLDRPNSYIGRAVPRPNLDRLMQGRGLYVSDIELPRMKHAVFLRSPHAYARIVSV